MCFECVHLTTWHSSCVLCFIFMFQIRFGKWWDSNRENSRMQQVVKDIWILSWKQMSNSSEPIDFKPLPPRVFRNLLFSTSYFKALPPRVFRNLLFSALYIPLLNPHNTPIELSLFLQISFEPWKHIFSHMCKYWYATLFSFATSNRKK